ncbi:AraC family transcriptional regulator [Paraburkholderia sp. D15]|uniref:helix-turn-helix domain-containing protein n=1 Tax=Paraburkholderia sp. D15 TaxID=2880218 RepID=UPI002479CDB3|nr:AraC family transcriptional regulator [Paraburkholderia sp. D15]WGS51117.1 AraC family transcriptional regulator [Paraburkholderia sp. D15]
MRFEQEQNLFSFDAAFGNRPIAVDDPLAHRQVLEVLQHVLPPEPEGTEFLESIERTMRRDLRHAPSLAAIAAQLCMSERTLRRRLADQGVSYQTVIDTIHRKRAFTLLSNPRLSIEDVAREVGSATHTTSGARSSGGPGTGRARGGPKRVFIFQRSVCSPPKRFLTPPKCVFGGPKRKTRFGRWYCG